MEMIVALLVLSIIESGLSQMIHEDLTSTEYAELFPMVEDTEVPEYEILPIHRSRIRKSAFGAIPMRMNAFGKNIKLWLNPIDSILATAETPVFTVKRGIRLKLHAGEMAATIRKMYEDESYAATISVDEMPDGRVELNGIIGTKHIHIRPVPRKHLKKLRRRRHSIDNITDSEIHNYTYHILYKIPEASEYLKTLKTPAIKNALRSKRSVPPVIYPEIMVIVDYPLFKLLNHDFYTTLAYVVAFWNGVDLKYRTFEYPRIRMNIAGVIIATEPNSLEYTLPHARNGDLLINNALANSRTWVVDLRKQLNGYYSFDMTFTLTSEYFCSMEYNRCVRKIIGITYLGSACPESNEIYETHSTALVQDRSAFEGILVAAHELAHLLGADHDGENNACQFDQGNIMSPTVTVTSKTAEFSYCTLNKMDAYMKREPTCLYNMPRGKGKIVPRFLPGKLMDANEQCRRLMGLGGQAVFIDKTICTILYCKSQYYPQGIGNFAAVDGTPCAQGKLCLHGKCISEINVNYYV